MANLNAYSLRRQIESIILQHGGVVFGGHVRDVILHEIHAAEYYKHAGKDAQTKYTDPDFLPEWNGRLVVSSDIDCYMVSHSIEAFVDNLRDNNIHVHKVFEKDDAKKYLPMLDVPPGVLRHLRFQATNLNKSIIRYVTQLLKEGLNDAVQSYVSQEISAFESSLRNASTACEPLTVDVFVADCYNFHKICPPFNTVDFECNGLLLTKNGISLSSSVYPMLSITERQDTLCVIIQDIKMRKAVYVDSLLSITRMNKMRAKGWTIGMKYVCTHEDPPHDKDVCIMCHDDIDSKYYKLPCCNAMYHKSCLVGVLSSTYGEKCIMCKNPTPAYLDLALLKNE